MGVTSAKAASTAFGGQILKSGSICNSHLGYANCYVNFLKAALEIWLFWCDYNPLQAIAQPVYN